MTAIVAARSTAGLASALASIAPASTVPLSIAVPPVPPVASPLSVAASTVPPVPTPPLPASPPPAPEAPPLGDAPPLAGAPPAPATMLPPMAPPCPVPVAAELAQLALQHNAARTATPLHQRPSFMALVLTAVAPH